jgi:branched-chain amino acid transport system permease protein
MTEIVQQILNALSLGSLYALLALGLATVFSVLGLVNFAHGELITITGFTMLLMSRLGIPEAFFIPLGIAGATVGAVAMERVAFRPFRNAPPTTLLVTSFGLSIVIQQVLLLLTEPKPLPVQTPAVLRTRFSIGPIDVQMLQVLMTGVTALALIALVMFLRRSLSGVAMRAAAEKFDILRLMGVRADRVITWAFAVSGFLAGIAGVFIVARRGAVDPFMGFVFVLKAFVAAVLGGFGSLIGAVLGGFALGILEVSLEVALPSSVAGFRDAFVFALVGLVLIVRPQGIFGERERVEI